jgi:hypothetical protein
MAGKLALGYRLTRRWGSITKKRRPAASQMSNLQIETNQGSSQCWATVPRGMMDALSGAVTEWLQATLRNRPSALPSVHQLPAIHLDGFAGEVFSVCRG